MFLFWDPWSFMSYLFWVKKCKCTLKLLPTFSFLLSPICLTTTSKYERHSLQFYRANTVPVRLHMFKWCNRMFIGQYIWIPSEIWWWFTGYPVHHYIPDPWIPCPLFWTWLVRNVSLFSNCSLNYFSFDYVT